MRFRTALSLAALFVVCFTVASWATPTPERILPPRAAPYPDTQSQSGKVASVSDAAFALEVTQGQERKTIEFLIDGNTKVEGKLEIGSHAMGRISRRRWQERRSARCRRARQWLGSAVSSEDEQGRTDSFESAK